MVSVLYCVIFACHIPLISQFFLKSSLCFLILLFSSISLHYSLRKLLYLSLLFFGTLIQMDISFFFSFAFSSLLSLGICKASSDSHFALLHVFFLRIVLFTTSCTKLQTSVHSSSGTLSIRSNLLNLFVTSTI